MRRKVTDLFIEGYLNAMEGKNKWVKLLPILLWLLLYLVLIVVVACLATEYQQSWLYVCDAGFVLLLLGIIGSGVDYIIRHR